MTGPTPDATTYSLRSLERTLGVSRTVVAGLVAAGFVTPARGPRNDLRFSFQDVVLLRTAHGLQAARIPRRKILQALTRLRAQLPPSLPLSGLRITAVGNDVVVHDGDARWAADTGQMVMDFDVASVAAGVAILPHAAPRAPAADDDAQTWFLRGEALERADPSGAEAAYRRALEIAPDHVAACLNLGALLCDAQRCGEAVDLFDGAVARIPDNAALQFNRAIALEDAGRPQEALDAYERALVIDPDLADAHFNAARLHEQLGDPQRALRHYSAYRRLSPT